MKKGICARLGFCSFKIQTGYGEVLLIWKYKNLRPIYANINLILIPFKTEKFFRQESHLKCLFFCSICFLYLLIKVWSLLLSWASDLLISSSFDELEIYFPELSDTLKFKDVANTLSSEKSERDKFYSWKRFKNSFIFWFRFP